MQSLQPNLETQVVDCRCFTFGGWRVFVVALVLVSLGVFFGNPNYRWSTERDGAFGSDFLQEWVGACIVSSPQSGELYDLEQFKKLQHDDQLVGFRWDATQYYPPVYPPIYYLLFVPLTWVQYRWAVMIWGGTLLVSFVLAIYLIERIFVNSKKFEYASWFWMAGLLAPGVIAGWTMGQKGTLFLLLLTCVWLAWTQKKDLIAGLFFGLILVKPTMAFLIPVIMLINCRWRFTVGVSITGLGLLLFGFLFFSPTLWTDYLNVASGAATYQSNGGYRYWWSSSLWTLLSPFDPRVKFVVVGLVFAMVLVGLRNARATAIRSPEWLLQCLIATALLSPHFYYYDLVVLLLPIRLLLNESVRKGVHAFAIIVGSVAMAVYLEELIAFPSIPIGLAMASIAVSGVRLRITAADWGRIRAVVGQHVSHFWANERIGS